jgi:hypothetical protein
MRPHIAIRVPNSSRITLSLSTVPLFKVEAIVTYNSNMK